MCSRNEVTIVCLHKARLTLSHLNRLFFLAVVQRLVLQGVPATIDNASFAAPAQLLFVGLSTSRKYEASVFEL